MSNDGVHATHCCAAHGCKYGKDDDCPVVAGRVSQEYPCEECGEVIQPAWGHWQPIAVYDKLKSKPKLAAFRFEPVSSSVRSVNHLGETVQLTRYYGSRVCTHWTALPNTDRL